MRLNEVAVVQTSGKLAMCQAWGESPLPFVISEAPAECKLVYKRCDPSFQ